MTVVAAVTDGVTVWTASDSLISADEGAVLGHSPKTDRCLVGGHDVVYAFAGRAALQALVRAHLDFPTPTLGSWDRWAQQTAEAVTRLAVATVPPLTDDEGAVDAVGLLGCAGRIWYLLDNLAVDAGGYAAIGSGAELALGALEALAGADPQNRVVEAVRVACLHRSDCRPPVHLTVVGDSAGITTAA